MTDRPVWEVIDLSVARDDLLEALRATGRLPGRRPTPAPDTIPGGLPLTPPEDP